MKRHEIFPGQGRPGLLGYCYLGVFVFLSFRFRFGPSRGLQHVFHHLGCVGLDASRRSELEKKPLIIKIPLKPLIVLI